MIAIAVGQAFHLRLESLTYEMKEMAMPDQPEIEPSFEEALSQLERIVENLERGEPELTTRAGQV